MKWIFSLVSLLAIAAPAQAANMMYKVTIKNHMKAQPLSPPVFAFQGEEISLFEVGAPASPGLTGLAEDGETAGLLAEINALSPNVNGWAAKNPIMPGKSRTYILTLRPSVKWISYASMLGTTNDSFVAVENLVLPTSGVTKLYATPYDAGTERNSESCAYIPGPPCGSMKVRDPSPGEFVQLSTGPGINGIGDLDNRFTWDDRSVEITVMPTND